MVAFGTSLAATFGIFEVEVWWELASLITVMVLGHWLEMRAIAQASGAFNALEVINAAAGAPPHRVKMVEIMRRHGLTPAPLRRRLRRKAQRPTTEVPHRGEELCFKS